MYSLIAIYEIYKKTISQTDRISVIATCRSLDVLQRIPNWIHLFRTTIEIKPTTIVRI